MFMRNCPGYNFFCLEIWHKGRSPTGKRWWLLTLGFDLDVELLGPLELSFQHRIHISKLHCLSSMWHIYQKCILCPHWDGSCMCQRQILSLYLPPMHRVQLTGPQRWLQSHNMELKMIILCSYKDPASNAHILSVHLSALTSKASVQEAFESFRSIIDYFFCFREIGPYDYIRPTGVSWLVAFWSKGPASRMREPYSFSLCQQFLANSETEKKTIDSTVLKFCILKLIFRIARYTY